MEISWHDGDNFIRNMVTVKCGGGSWQSPPARKMGREDQLPVSVEELMLDLKIDSDEEADTLVRMERGAAAFIERRTGYVIIPGRYQVDMPGWWSGPLEIMRGPLRQLVEIQYLDADGASQVADPAGFYIEEQDRSFGVLPLSSYTRPTLWSEVRRVRLVFDAGYRLPDESGSDDGLELEDGLKTCLIMLVGHYYANRELFAAGKLESNDAAGRDLLGAYRQFW